jgi:hypothetical protein
LRAIAGLGNHLRCMRMSALWSVALRAHVAEETSVVHTCEGPVKAPRQLPSPVGVAEASTTHPRACLASIDYIAEWRLVMRGDCFHPGVKGFAGDRRHS